MENQTDQNLNQALPVPPVDQAPSFQTPPVSNPINQPAGGPKSKLPILIIGIILFFLIVGSAAGFYVFKQQSLKTAIKPTTIVQKQISTPTPDITASWKTYISKDHTFSFKYPDSFNVIDDGSSGAAFHLRLQKDINAREADDKLTISSDDSVTDGAKTSIYVQSDNRIFIKETNNISFIKFNVDNNQVFSTCTYRSSQGMITTCNQILSTFKFTDNKMVDTSTWKTAKTSFAEFKYPPEWGYFWTCEKGIYVIVNNGQGPQDANFPGCPFDGGSKISLGTREKPYKSLIDEVPKSSVENTGSGTSTETVSNVNTFTVDGKSAIMWQTDVVSKPNPGMGDGNYVQVDILPNYYIILSDPLKDLDNFKALLSTFKFTN